MNRTTILLPLVLKKKAEKKAKEKGVSLGEYIRYSLLNTIDSKDNSMKNDTFFSDTSVYTSNINKDLSINHDEYLYGEKF